MIETRTTKTARKRREIKQVILFWLFIITFSSCSLLTFFIIQVQYRNFINESRHFRQKYIDSQKLLLRQKVLEAVEYVNFNSDRTTVKLKENLRSRVDHAWNVADSLYTKYENSLSDTEIAELIKESLRPIRFDKGSGYLFAVSLDGTGELYPAHPELQGRNLIDLQDIMGNYVIRNEIKIVSESGEGFIPGYWPNPLIKDDSGSIEYSYLKIFKPLNWYIGTRGFLEEIEKAIQAETLDWLAKISFNQNSNIFASTIQGYALLMDGRIVKEPLNMWDRQDPSGVRVIQEEIRIAKTNPEGGFLQYSWPQKGGDIPVPVISFVLAVPQWDWIIGASMYLGDIEKSIFLQEERMQQNVYKDIKVLLFFMLTCILIIFLVSIFISRKLNRELFIFSSFFSQGKEKNVEIPLDDLGIKEFYELGEVANHMILRRQEVEGKLRLLSRTDPLTDLANRRDMKEKIDVESKRAERTGTSFAFILMDIDNFKAVNDTYGHDAGDAVLKRVAALLKDDSRLTDTLSRWGGEEFLLLLPNSNIDGAVATAEKFRKLIENDQITYEDHNINVSITLGVSLCHKGDSPERALSMADKALYQGKRFGKNRVIVANNIQSN